MTNAKAYQGFHDDKKVEEHCSITLLSGRNSYVAS